MLRTFTFARRLSRTTSIISASSSSWKTPIPTLSFLTTTTSTAPHHQQNRTYACQIHHPTKLGQLRAKLRTFGQGHIELDLHHSPGLALLTLTNPEKHNALTGKMMAELADCVDLLEAVTDPKRGNLTEEDLKELLKESGIVLKKAGVAVQKLDQESLKALRDGLVGVIVTGSQYKSYCAGL
ncbi:hypothetical protein BGZ89_011054, partial [Linnemannia elongata]